MTDRPAGEATSAASPPSNDPLTIERIAAVEPPREFAIHPRDRTVAYAAEAAGARQLFILSLRGGLPLQLTAGEKHASDPQWSPDGRRLAFVRDDAIWVVEADGSRETLVTAHPAGNSTPRWSPDGRALAFVSRRRGWSQIWIADAPVPRRGRPASRPRPTEPRAISAGGQDVELFAWSPDGRRFVVTGQRTDNLRTNQVWLVDVATGEQTVVAGEAEWACSPAWVADGSLLYLSDADGWFQVVRLSPDGRQRTVLTTEPRDHGEPTSGPGYRPLPSPDGRRFVHARFEDALVRLVLADLPADAPRRGGGRSRRRTDGEGSRIDPDDGVWRAVAWLPDGAWVAAVADSDSRPPDLWLLPVPGVAPSGSRPRQVTDSLPAVLAPAFSPGRRSEARRFAFEARDGLRVEGTLWRPRDPVGGRRAQRVPAMISAHGGPTSQSLRSWAPFKQLLVREGFAYLDVDFRGSIGYGRAFREANHDEWGHGDTHDIVDAARWALEQPWCDGRLAVFGGSYGGYLVLTALVDEPSIWQAGVDLYGDSEIAESYRHGDRLGRLDLHRMMGSPDDPDAAPRYRRGSPVYGAERIEAPVLILHGRKDKRVVPLMTERMVEALTIEGKHHEVHWYDDEGHGWERRENRRDAWQRILAFLRRHVLDVPPSGEGGR